MKYCLDTNHIIYYLKGLYPQVRERLLGTPRSHIHVSEIVHAELLFGVRKSGSQKNLEAVQAFLAPLKLLPFEGPCVEHYADICHVLEAKGTPIGPNDTLIAAIARAHGLTLVTNNLAEFRRVEGLRLESWV